MDSTTACTKKAEKKQPVQQPAIVTFFPSARADGSGVLGETDVCRDTPEKRLSARDGIRFS